MSGNGIITAESLQEELLARSIDHLWNVLTDEYWTGETIPSSQRRPVDRIARSVKQDGVAKDARIVVFCAGPHCPQSHAAADKLRTLGYRNVGVFEGGLDAWKAAGLPIEHHALIEVHLVESSFDTPSRGRA